MNQRQLAGLAIRAREEGTAWASFSVKYGDAVRELEPWNTQRFH